MSEHIGGPQRRSFLAPLLPRMLALIAGRERKREKARPIPKGLVKLYCCTLLVGLGGLLKGRDIFPSASNFRRYTSSRGLTLRRLSAAFVRSRCLSARSIVPALLYPKVIPPGRVQAGRADAREPPKKRGLFSYVCHSFIEEWGETEYRKKTD